MDRRSKRTRRVYTCYKCTYMKIAKTCKLLDYVDFVLVRSMYIETGSCTGESIQRALDAGFDRIKSVEAMLEYYWISLKRFAASPAAEKFIWVHRLICCL